MKIKLSQEGKKLLCEFLGTLFFIMTISMAASLVGDFAPLSIGFMLMSKYNICIYTYCIYIKLCTDHCACVVNSPSVHIRIYKWRPFQPCSYLWYILDRSDQERPSHQVHRCANGGFYTRCHLLLVNVRDWWKWELVGSPISSQRVIPLHLPRYVLRDYLYLRTRTVCTACCLWQE